MSKDLQLKYPPLDLLRINSEFASQRYSRTQHKVQSHEGIDFHAAIGDDLYNAHPGQVIFAGRAGGYGNAVVIQDVESGQSTLYAHLSEINIAKNQYLLGQTPIGKTGNSGGVPAHLHFEVINKEKSDQIKITGLTKGLGGRLNPREFLATAFPEIFSAIVDAREDGYDITGDHRDNTMIGNNKPNPMSGLTGLDTYQVGPGDTITDPDDDGVIDYSKGDISGNAECKTKKESETVAIEGQWISANNKFALVKDDSDLVILYKADAVVLEDLSGAALSTALVVISKGVRFIV